MRQLDGCCVCISATGSFQPRNCHVGYTLFPLDMLACGQNSNSDDAVMNLCSSQRAMFDETCAAKIDTRLGIDDTDAMC